jgi:ubiquinone/menaquinone biosynthesis C-methylase UbiE
VTHDWARGLRPVLRSHAAARATYDRIAGWYDWTEAPFEAGARRLGLRLLDVRPGETVLEVGFGTGHALVALARAVGPSGRVVGVDLAPRMRERAAARLRRAGLAGRVDLHTADAVALPVADGSVDAIFTSFVLELFTAADIARVLAECRRVLRPGGRICAITLARPDPPPLATRVYERVHDILPTLADCRPIRVAEALAAAGFTVRSVRRVSLVVLPADIVIAGR